MKRKFTCIICPNGCELEAIVEDGHVKSIEGATCKRGKEYVLQEITDPRRNIASSILIVDGELPLASVRLSKAIPKSEIFRVMDAIKSIKVQAPVTIGQVAIENVCNLKADVIITKNVNRAKK